MGFSFMVGGDNMIDQNKRDRPKPYIDRALDILYKNKKVFGIGIVEIGCMRSELKHHVDITDYECCNDGHSTYLFGRFGSYMISVDNNPIHINNAKKSCYCFENIQFYNVDAIEYVETYIISPANIGLLFLDAWDVDLPGCAEKHLEFYNTIKPFLNDDCMILIDDTDIYYDHDKKEFFPDETSMGGKGKLLIPELVKNGYEIIFKGRQTLLRKA